jgi:MFS transporter, BCD family, chlorophyll transporter
VDAAVSANSLGWGGIARLGLVQAAIGSIVVLATSTMNRVMVVELAMPAVLPGILVALHYIVQLARPRFGHDTDVGGQLTRWIVGGMAALAAGGIGAAASIGLMAVHPLYGVIAALAAYLAIGLGVGACGTSLLLLLAQRVAPERRAAAATVAWVLMIAGFVVTTAYVGHQLEPYSHARLLAITTQVALLAVVVTIVAVWGTEGSNRSIAPPAAPAAHRVSFFSALREVWRERAVRQFTAFVFVSMLAYSGQELIFEPFAGAVFDFTPAQSARLTSLQHGGVLLGMLLVATLCTLGARTRLGSLRGWTVGGCVGSSAAVAGLVLAARMGAHWPLHLNAFALGAANGVFTVAAIGSMMGLAGRGNPARRGVRMGLWGAAQALAFALGGLLSSAAVDLTRHIWHSTLLAYAMVFAAQAVLFVIGAVCGALVGTDRESHARQGALPHLGSGVSA